MAKRYTSKPTDCGYGPSVIRRTPPTIVAIYGLCFFGGIAYMAFLIIGAIVSSLFF
jgi:hypothetical protein